MSSIRHKSIPVHGLKDIIYFMLILLYEIYNISEVAQPKKIELTGVFVPHSGAWNMTLMASLKYISYQTMSIAGSNQVRQTRAPVAQVLISKN